MPSSAADRRRAGARLGVSDAERRAAMIRIDHAGERGAVAIYEAQRRVLAAEPSREPMLRLTEEMLAEERRHLRIMGELMHDFQVRPTALDIFWGPAADALGAITASMSDEAALSCTEAVELVIAEHYRDQAAQLDGFDPELAERCRRLADEEDAHRHTAEDRGAAAAFGHDALVGFISAACRAAIAVSSRF